MRILYHYPLCPFSRKVRLLLSEKKLDFTMKVEKFWEESNHLLKLNHAMEVPVFVDINGAVIPDSDAIVEYIEEVYNTSPSFLLDDYVLRAEIRRLNYWFSHRFASEITVPILKEKVVSRFIGKTPDAEIIRESYKKLDKHISYINWLVQRRNWLAGNDISLADLTASSQISVLDYFSEIKWGNNNDAKVWYMRLKSRPSFQPILNDRISVMQPSNHYKLLDF